MAGFGVAYYFWHTGGQDLSSAVSSFGAEIDDPVGSFYDVKVVLDDDDGVAMVGQAVQYLEQHFDILEVQTGRRLVQDIQGASGIALGEFQGQLDALRLAA